MMEEQIENGVQFDEDRTPYYDPNSLLTSVYMFGRSRGTTNEVTGKMLTRNSTMFLSSQARLNHSGFKDEKINKDDVYKHSFLAEAIVNANLKGKKTFDPSKVPLIISHIPTYTKKGDVGFDSVMHVKMRETFAEMCKLDDKTKLEDVESILLHEDSYVEEKDSISEITQYVNRSKKFYERNHVLLAVIKMKDGRVIRKSGFLYRNPNQVCESEDVRKTYLSRLTDTWNSKIPLRKPDSERLTAVYGDAVIDMPDPLEKGDRFAEHYLNIMRERRAKQITEEAIKLSDANTNQKFTKVDMMPGYDAKLPHVLVLYLSDPDNLLAEKGKEGDLRTIAEMLVKNPPHESNRIGYEKEPQAVFLELHKNLDGHVYALATYVRSPINDKRVFDENRYDNGQNLIKRKAIFVPWTPSSLEEYGTIPYEEGSVEHNGYLKEAKSLKTFGSQSAIFAGIFRADKDRTNALAAPFQNFRPQDAGRRSIFVSMPDSDSLGLSWGSGKDASSVIRFFGKKGKETPARTTEVTVIGADLQREQKKLRIVYPDPQRIHTFILHYPDNDKTERERADQTYTIHSLAVFMGRDDINHTEKDRVLLWLATPRDGDNSEEYMEQLCSLLAFGQGDGKFSKELFIKNLAKKYDDPAMIKSIFLLSFLKKVVAEGCLIHQGNADRLLNPEMNESHLGPAASVQPRMTLFIPREGLTFSVKPYGGTVTVHYLPEKNQYSISKVSGLTFNFATGTFDKIIPGKDPVHLPPPMRFRPDAEFAHDLHYGDLAQDGVGAIPLNGSEYLVNRGGAKGYVKFGMPQTLAKAKDWRSLIEVKKDNETIRILKLGSPFAFTLYEPNGNEKSYGKVANAADLRSRNSGIADFAWKRDAYELITTPLLPAPYQRDKIPVPADIHAMMHNSLSFSLTSVEPWSDAVIQGLNDLNRAIYALPQEQRIRVMNTLATETRTNPLPGRNGRLYELKNEGGVLRLSNESQQMARLSLQRIADLFHYEQNGKNGDGTNGQLIAQREKFLNEALKLYQNIPLEKRGLFLKAFFDSMEQQGNKDGIIPKKNGEDITKSFDAILQELTAVSYTMTQSTAQPDLNAIRLDGVRVRMKELVPALTEPLQAGRWQEVDLRLKEEGISDDLARLTEADRLEIMGKINELLPIDTTVMFEVKGNGIAARNLSDVERAGRRAAFEKTPEGQELLKREAAMAAFVKKVTVMYMRPEDVTSGLKQLTPEFVKLPAALRPNFLLDVNSRLEKKGSLVRIEANGEKLESGEYDIWKGLDGGAIGATAAALKVLPSLETRISNEQRLESFSAALKVLQKGMEAIPEPSMRQTYAAMVKEKLAGYRISIDCTIDGNKLVLKNASLMDKPPVLETPIFTDSGTMRFNGGRLQSLAITIPGGEKIVFNANGRVENEGKLEASGITYTASAIPNSKPETYTFDIRINLPAKVKITETTYRNVSSERTLDYTPQMLEQRQNYQRFLQAQINCRNRWSVLPSGETGCFYRYGVGYLESFNEKTKEYKMLKVDFPESSSLKNLERCTWQTIKPAPAVTLPERGS